MTTLATEQAVQTMEIVKHEQIDAPIEIVFQALLDELGPESQMPNGTSLNLKLEPWPGGRWYRDLGNNTGHFWGHVQVIKPPKLLELAGPMFMSYPATSHVQYRLTEEGAATRLKICHRAMGLISAEHAEGVGDVAKLCAFCPGDLAVGDRLSRQSAREGAVGGRDVCCGQVVGRGYLLQGVRLRGLEDAVLKDLGELLQVRDRAGGGPFVEGVDQGEPADELHEGLGRRCRG